IQKGEIGARERASAADRDAQCLGGEFMVVGEILGDQGGAIARIGHRNVGGVRLGSEKRFQIVPLVGDNAVQRIVNKNGEIQISAVLPVGNLRALLVQIKLDVVFGNEWRTDVFLANSSYRHGDGSWTRGDSVCCEYSGYQDGCHDNHGKAPGCYFLDHYFSVSPILLILQLTIGSADA